MWLGHERRVSRAEGLLRSRELSAEQLRCTGPRNRIPPSPGRPTAGAHVSPAPWQGPTTPGSDRSWTARTARSYGILEHNATHPVRPSASASPGSRPAGPSGSTSPRRSREAVRNPRRRKTATGGHQPWTACWSRNPATAAGRRKNRRSTNVPSPSPIRATVAALASSVRSMSHSRPALQAAVDRLGSCTGDSRATPLSIRRRMVA